MNLNKLNRIVSTVIEFNDERVAYFCQYVSLHFASDTIANFIAKFIKIRLHIKSILNKL